MTDLDARDRFEAEFARTDASNDPFVSAVRATRMPMLITDPHQADNPIVFVNAAFSRLTGYDHNEIIGRNCRFLQGPDTDKEDVARIRSAIERRVPIEIELLNHKKNGEVFWNRLLISPVFDRSGELTYFFASQFDVTIERDKLARVQADRDALEREIEQRTADLQHSEERLRFILKAGRLGSWTLDLADMRFEASDTCKADLGRSPHEACSFEDLIAAIVPEDRERMHDALLGSVATRADYDIEYRVQHPGGEVRWLQVRGQPFYGADGRPVTMAGITLDITDRKANEHQRALLAGELNHRVKNSMATMQSIAHHTLRNAPSLGEAYAVLSARLQSLATAHDVLTRLSWTVAPLNEVADKALQPFRGGSGQRFVFDGPPVWLTSRLTLALAMTFHELATNAAKYGALSTDGGHVVLGWEIIDGAEPARLRLRWEEIGGPEVAPPTRGGFGSRLIERALAADIGGTATIEYRPQGVVFTLEAPLPQAASGVPEAALDLRPS